MERLLEVLFQLSSRFKYVIIVAWILLAGSTVYFIPKFLTSTTNSFTPPKSSLAHQANLNFSYNFPVIASQSNFAIYSTTSSQDIICPAFWDFSKWVATEVGNVSLSQAGKKVPYLVTSFEGYYSWPGIAATNPQFRAQFVAPDNRSALITFAINISYSARAASQYAQLLERSISQYWANFEEKAISSTLTGIPAFVPIMQQTVETDLTLMDGIVLPIAFAILAYIVRSLRLLLSTIVALCVSLSYGLMYPVALGMEIVSFTPSLMMALILAMSIDYSLFLLTRYREELFEKGVDGPEAVKAMLKTAGHTIVISGPTLIFCFLGLTILPLDFVQSTGIGAAVAIFFTLCVNLTLIPSILLAFPQFFANCVQPFDCCGRTITFGARSRDTGAFVSDNSMEEGVGTPLLKTGLAREKSYWWRLGKFLSMERFPRNIIVLVAIVAVCIPFDYFAFRPNMTESLSVVIYLPLNLQFLPRGQNSTTAYLDMGQKFGFGKLYPYSWLIAPNGNQSVLNPNFFDTTQRIVGDFVQAVPNVTSDNVIGLALPVYAYSSTSGP